MLRTNLIAALLILASWPTGSHAQAVQGDPWTASAVTTQDVAQAAGEDGLVEARLLTPLIVRGRTVLAKGTRAFGAAAVANDRRTGTSRVTIVFETFVTPEGKMFRRGGPPEIVGEARDPRDGLTGLQLGRSVGRDPTAFRGAAGTSFTIVFRRPPE